MTTMRDQFRTHKSKIKRDHYTKYDTDEERLQNRPRSIPLVDFKIILGYWADEKVQVIILFILVNAHSFGITHFICYFLSFVG